MKKRFAAVSLVFLLFALSSGLLAQTIHPKGVTIWDWSRARNGLTFIAAPDGSARLVGMLGNVVNTWTAPTANDGLIVKMPILASPGHIVAVHGPIAVPGYVRLRGSILTEFDYAGNTVWEYTAPSMIDVFPFGGFHHDLTRLDNGNTLALASVLVDAFWLSSKTLIDDCLLEIDRSGKIVWAWYTWQHFDDFQFTDTARSLIYNVGGDWAHANSVTVVPPNDLFDLRFKPGNIVLSYRNLNTIIVIDKATGAIVWKMGPNNSQTIGQHYVQMIPQGLQGAGHLIAFDNGASAGYPPISREFSRVVEIDPLQMTIPWKYTASFSGQQDWTLYSPFIGGAQRLQAGNTLITEGMKGRIAEVTSTGAIVWEYMSPFSETRTEDGNPVVDYNVFRAIRLPVWWPWFGATPGSV